MNSVFQYSRTSAVHARDLIASLFLEGGVFESGILKAFVVSGHCVGCIVED